jgi:hypothetical protein
MFVRQFGRQIEEAARCHHQQTAQPCQQPQGQYFDQKTEAVSAHDDSEEKLVMGQAVIVPAQLLALPRLCL